MGLRMLAVAGILLAASRPLSRGWLALAGGGRADTSIVILDRSPSMQQRDPPAVDSKLDTGRRQLRDALETLAAGRLVVITDPEREPIELESPTALLELSATGPAAAAADLPLLLQRAYDFIRKHAAGSTEVWICSDQRQNDWNAESGGWDAIRDAFARLPQPVRFQLLSYAQAEPGNVAVRVTAVRLRPAGDEQELLVTVQLSRQADGPSVTVPLRFEIGGATSAVDVELSGNQAVLANHPIPLERSAGPRGWGRVSIPADANPADNEFFFVHDRPAPRRAIVVADDPAVRRILSLVAGTPADPARACTTDVVAVEDLATTAWDDVAVLLWQAALPEGEVAAAVGKFVDRGGQAIFFPPSEPTDRSFAGVSWTQWTGQREPVRPATWRGDQDLLAGTASGAALPVGELEILRSCGIAGDCTPLAELPGGVPLVARAVGARGGVYFCGTTPVGRDSTLAEQGVVLYALVQRAIDRGAEVLGTTRQVDAGTSPAGPAWTAGEWRRVAGVADASAAEPGRHAGVFARDDWMVAVNRPAAEDAARILPDERIDRLFGGLRFSRVVGLAGSEGSLVQEIWRLFLVAMLLALIGEAALCLPRRGRPEARAAGLPTVEAGA
jgi:hypothetical protein